MMGWNQQWTFQEVVTRVVEEPILIGFKTLDNRMPSIDRVMTGVLRGRRVATADVTAVGAATQVKPPTARLQTLDTA